MVFENIEEAKEYIIKEMIPNINFENNSSIRGKKLYIILNILENFRPDLLNYLNILSLKRQIIFCLLNDYIIYRQTKYINIDSNLKRVTKEIDLVSFFNLIFSHKSSFKFKYDKIIMDFGMDLKYPRLLNYSSDKIYKIAYRLSSKLRICKNCNKKFRTIDYSHHKRKVCSKECYNELISKRMKLNNPVYRYNPQKKLEISIKQSKSLKDKIQNGEFTPCVTNSWANSKIFLKLYNLNFRSSWEAYFYIFMKSNNINLKYEKCRIKYFDSIVNKERNYIVDFIDETNKILYEIKPLGYKDSINVKDKENATFVWCKENGFNFVYISEEWFNKNYKKDLIFSNEIDDKYKIKLEKALKQFERI